jgi:ribosomal protein S18 acetylase RimI-like enzyme
VWLPIFITNMQIQPLRESDYRTVKGIFRNTFDRTEFPVSDLNISWYNRNKEESLGFFLKGVLIGFLISSFHTLNKDNLYVDYIAFDEAYRGKGIGTQLLSGLLIEIKKNNRSVHLYPERPELWPWYQRLGFQRTHNGYFNFHSYNTRSRINT